MYERIQNTKKKVDVINVFQYWKLYFVQAKIQEQQKQKRKKNK